MHIFSEKAEHWQLWTGGLKLSSLVEMSCNKSLIELTGYPWGWTLSTSQRTTPEHLTADTRYRWIHDKIPWSRVFRSRQIEFVLIWIFCLVLFCVKFIHSKYTIMCNFITICLRGYLHSKHRARQCLYNQTDHCFDNISSWGSRHLVLRKTQWQ